MDGRRVDLRVVPYNVSVLVGYELYRVAIRRERPMCRSVSVECYSYCPKLSHFIGAQSEGSAPHFILPSVHHLTSLPFLSGSGESENVRISLAECGSEQPEIVARNTATPKFAQTKNKERKSPWLKF